MKVDRLLTETNPCGLCKHYHKKEGDNLIGICQAKLMFVTSDMLVTFKSIQGTCFEYLKK